MTDAGHRPVALVTGASTGIGEAIAAALAQDGYRVFGTSRSAHADTNGITMLLLDVRDDASVVACIEEVRAQAGDIDLLVSTASPSLSWSRVYSRPGSSPKP